MKTPIYTLLSPSKSLDFTRRSDTLIPKGKKSSHLGATKELHRVLKELSEQEVGQLMGISPKLAELNYRRFQGWNDSFTKQECTVEGEKNYDYALRAFVGDVYRGIDVEAYTASDWEYADEHIGILSGFYGILSPLTYIKPYRLEMGTRLRCERGGVQHANLYEFWGDTIAKHINTITDSWENPIILNLASLEYAKAACRKLIHADVIDVDFKVDRGDGKLQVVAIYAKKARGTLANLIIQKRIESLKELKREEPSGFKFDKNHSTQKRLVYVKKIKKV